MVRLPVRMLHEIEKVKKKIKNKQEIKASQSLVPCLENGFFLINKNNYEYN